MAKRNFGDIPGWAKNGPVTLQNYDYRAEAWCFNKTSERAGKHPTIKLDSMELNVWRDYFDRFLGGRPWAFSALCRDGITEMTVPEQQPQDFDLNYGKMVLAA